jgi:hypothetical protein
MISSRTKTSADTAGIASSKRQLQYGLFKACQQGKRESVRRFDHGGYGHVGLPNHIFNINRYLIDRFVVCPGNYAERPTPDSGKARVN